MKCIHRAWVGRILVASPCTVFSVPSDHGPLLPAEVRLWSPSACETSREIRARHPASASALFWNGADKLELSILETRYAATIHQGTKVKAGPVHVPVTPTMPFDVSESAICDDLNEDGVVDWVVTLWLHGNGLAAAEHMRLIVLSAGERYRSWLVPTLWPSGEDFVTYPMGGNALLTTSYYRTPSESPHSYYVYDLWRFDRAGAIVSANEIDARFPRAVWLTYGENHQPAASLRDALNEVERPLPRELE